jgi:hypothetical protein
MSRTINEKKRRDSDARRSRLQSTARSPGYAAQIGAVLVQSSSSEVHGQSRKSKLQRKDPSFARHSEDVTIYVLDNIATINNRTYWSTTDCTAQQQWHPITLTLTTLQPRRLQAMSNIKNCKQSLFQ